LLLSENLHIPELIQELCQVFSGGGFVHLMLGKDLPQNLLLRFALQ
jgi:hypothetical protein